MEQRKIQGMKEAYEIVALLVARGCSNSEISEATGYNANYVWRIKTEVKGFDALVANFKHEIQQRLIDETVDAATMFNRKVPVMVDNLEDLALTANKEGVRLRATMDWLDRAPDEPKRDHRQENLDEHKIIFGVQQVDNMKKALSHIGADEVVDLLEGEDFIVSTVGEAVNIDDD